MKAYGWKRRALGRVAALFVFAAGGCLISSSVAQDFDFYATDLISQESFKKISMDLRDANLKDVLKIFSEQSGLNFIASEAIQDRRMTLFLDGVPLNDALKKIMAANNLTYDLDPGSNVFIVKETGQTELQLETRIYPLRYSRLKTSNLQKHIDTGAESGAVGVAATASSSGGGGGGGVGIMDTLFKILTLNGKIVCDERTNSLIITDVRSQFDVIEKVLRLLDSPTPQVMIEVEMLDVSKRAIDEMGVETSSGLMSLTGGSVDTRFPNFYKKNDVIVAGGTAPAFQYGKLSAEMFGAVLEYLRTDTKTKFLARPRILTLSNETAEIKISTQEAIGEQTIQVTTGNTTQTQTGAERFETGVHLKVTPQIDIESGDITMFIVPTVTESRTGATFNGTTYRDPEVRTSVTTLRVRDGETIVVGGLLKDKNEKTIKKMPLLGDLPVIGLLFRHKDESSEERELLVFITPHIVTFDNAVALAQNKTVLPMSSSAPSREQPVAVSRKREVDSFLEQWEN